MYQLPAGNDLLSAGFRVSYDVFYQRQTPKCGKTLGLCINYQEEKNRRERSQGLDLLGDLPSAVAFSTSRAQIYRQV